MSKGWFSSGGSLVPFPGTAVSGGGSADEDPDQPPRDGDDEGGIGTSLLTHLDEFRKRLVYAVIAVAIGFFIAFTFIQPIFDFIMKPLQAALPAGGKLIYTEPSEAFVLYIQLAALVGLLLASPFIMTQVWLLIAPWRYQREKTMAIPFVVMSSFFFIAGAAFSHYVVFPLVWAFFLGFTTDIVTFTPRLAPTFSMYIKLSLAFGLVFEMPTLALFLARMGMITPRFMLRHFKYAVLVIFIVAAIITPPDVVSQVAMALPLVGLYAFSILLAWMFGKTNQVAADAGE